MMTEDEGFIPDCYHDLREAMIEFMTAKDNGFDGNYQQWCEMERAVIHRDQNESALTRAVQDLQREGATRESIRDMVDEALT